MTHQCWCATNWLFECNYAWSPRIKLLTRYTWWIFLASSGIRTWCNCHSHQGSSYPLIKTILLFLGVVQCLTLNSVSLLVMLPMWRTCKYCYFPSLHTPHPTPKPTMKRRVVSRPWSGFIDGVNFVCKTHCLRVKVGQEKQKSSSSIIIVPFFKEGLNVMMGWTSNPSIRTILCTEHHCCRSSLLGYWA